MSREQIRLECLKLAFERLGPQAVLADVWKEANRLLAYVDGFDEISEVNGEPMASKRL